MAFDLCRGKREWKLLDEIVHFIQEHENVSRVVFLLNNFATITSDQIDEDACNQTV